MRTLEVDMVSPNEKLIHGVPVRPRVILKPKVEVSVRTEQERAQVVETAKRVITRHRKVLEALKDR